ncbi:MAG: S8 family peptidase [Hydrogenophaga sp.]|uniref:S8 family peptidase n=1 Tax=Hydrogenophaga sp. TaxID=1904254 RepID=UPI001E0846FE|nr:S8 family serine peptidase [Hydrogenophaga sp.]MBX3608461.1 S8 family peptidase [Hydrogenophaga sp.]
MRCISHIAHLARLGLCVSLLWLAGAAHATGEQAVLGLIVGYHDNVDDLNREATDRGPWGDRRLREQAAWHRAVKRSREHTAEVAKAADLPVDSVGEAGRAALIRLQRPLKGRELRDAMRRLRLHPDVAWVEPNVLERNQLVPNDPAYADQWHLKAPTTVPDFQPSALNMPSAWDITTGAATNTVVAVVDTGVRFSHPDLAGRLIGGYDFISELSVANDGNGRDADPSDPGDWVSAGDLANPLFSGCDVDDSSWHGTFIAGQIAALSDNSTGVSGLHWGAKVVPVRVAGKCGALVSDLLDGVRWAAGLPVSGVPNNPNPAKVINLSFGGSTSCTAAYQSMADDVRNAGALLVVAAGNNSAPLRRPADCNGVMAVAAVRRDGAKADYSSFGSNVALSAPGGSGSTSTTLLLSTDNAGTTGPGADVYGYKMGTSFSAPLASGVAALMLTINSSLQPGDLIERMKTGARAHTSYVGPTCSTTNTGVCNCTTSTCGAGLLDANASLQLAFGPAAIIAAIGNVNAGATVTLDGRSSVAISGRSITSYQWTLVSGPTTVTIPDSTQAMTSVQLPYQAGTWVFRLKVQDNLGDEGSDTVAAVASLPAGGGGGSMGRWWGAGLWLWLIGLIWRQRRTAKA